VIYTSLYGNLGSIAGKLTLAGESTPANRIATGDLTWLKPTNTSRTYASTLGPLHLSAYGQYLAPAASGSIALGLPTAGTASLNFTDGGLHLATIDPDLPAFTYNSNYTVTPPTAGSMDNPGKVTLAINKSSGAVSGTFTLLDGTLTRKVSYQGYIVRPASGNVKARGYFLLPQIPVSGQTSSTTPILSGGVQIAQ
jgi:hypothetical protein